MSDAPGARCRERRLRKRGPPAAGLRPRRGHRAAAAASRSRTKPETPKQLLTPRSAVAIRGAGAARAGQTLADLPKEARAEAWPSGLRQRS